MVVPRNGLGNRLQAWASAATLARTWQAPLDLLWEPQPAGPNTFDQLFNDLPHTFGVDQQLVASSDLEAVLGADHNSLPRYLTADGDRKVIFLAGHERGEQAFMPRLEDLVRNLDGSWSLVVVAGGLFHIDSSDGFSGSRREFYRSLQWSNQIQDLAASVRPSEPYSGLHIRHTDRSREAPRSSDIRAALGQLRASNAPESLFIAADTKEARLEWANVAGSLGFRPWSVPQVELTRSAPKAGISAAVDWLLLSDAQGLVYPRASTFSAEAAVAGGGHGIALSASRTVMSARSALNHARNAWNFPRRLWQSIEASAQGSNPS